MLQNYPQDTFSYFTLLAINISHRVTTRSMTDSSRTLRSSVVKTEENDFEVLVLTLQRKTKTNSRTNKKGTSRRGFKEYAVKFKWRWLNLKKAVILLYEEPSINERDCSLQSRQDTKDTCAASDSECIALHAERRLFIDYY